MRKSVFLFGMMLFILMGAEAVSGQILDKKQATPQRPSIATSTFTTYPGSFELESGFSLTDKLLDIQSVLKYGAGLKFEMFLMFSPYVLDTDLKSSGIGDVYVGGRYRFWMNFYEDKSIAVQAWAKLPAAPTTRSWSSGEADFQGMLIYTAVYEKYVIDINLGLTAYGRPHGVEGPDNEPFATICYTANLTNKFSILAEVHNYKQKRPSQNVSVGLAGFSYAFKPTIVFDAGYSFGLKDSPYDRQALSGFTINF